MSDAARARGSQELPGEGKLTQIVRGGAVRYCQGKEVHTGCEERQSGTPSGR